MQSYGTRINKHSINTLNWRKRRVAEGGQVVTLLLNAAQVKALQEMANPDEKIGATLRRIVLEYRQVF